MKKRSITIAGHRTSVTLEDEFWEAFKTLAETQKRPLASLIVEIDENRGKRNLSSAIRVHVLKTLQNMQK